MDSRACWALVVLLLAPAAVSAGPRSRPADKGKPPASEVAVEGEGDPALIAVMHDLNEGLRAEWMDMRAQQIELLSLSQTRPGGRIQPRAFRWVPGDPRRNATGHHLTYLIDSVQGGPASVATPQQVDQAFGWASDTWDAVSCADSLLVRRPHLGDDPDLFDAVFGYGTLGTFPAADVVFAGFLPRTLFDLVAPPSGGAEVIAFAVTFIFVDAEGLPTDLDGDGYLDAAASEIYFNDGFVWSSDGAAGSIDLQTVALHELGHALGIGHIEGMESAMGAIYGGVRRELQPLDLANACSLWGSRAN